MPSSGRRGGCGRLSMHTMWGALRPLALASSLALCCCGLDDAAAEGACPSTGGPGCKEPVAAAAAPAKRRHPWPNKGGNLNVSGFTESIGPSDVQAASWVWSIDVVNVHTSPVIDDEGNVYYSDTNGGIISLRKDGTFRWFHHAPGHNAGSPALHGDLIFCFTDIGLAFALELATGKTRWEQEVGMSGPRDSAAMVVAGDVVIMPVNLEGYSTDGNCDFVALGLEDGKKKWSYSVCNVSGQPSVNAQPAVVDGLVIVHDRTGGMHAFSAEDGRKRWYVEGVSNSTRSNGGSAVGPNNLAYCGFNREGDNNRGLGMVRAHDISTGKVAWSRTFDRGVNAGVAVGRLGPKGPLAVIALVSDDFRPPLKWWQRALFAYSTEWAVWGLQNGGDVFKGTVAAMDAQTGEDLWTFDVRDKHDWAWHNLASGCVVAAFGAPSIGGDGTVYVNWSKGSAYAIRDANGDGRIDAGEVTQLHHHGGTNGQTAIAQGLVVAPSCNALVGWTA